MLFCSISCPFRWIFGLTQRAVLLLQELRDGFTDKLRHGHIPHFGQLKQLLDEGIR